MTKSLASKHPHYTEQLPDWIRMRDTYKGQRKIKSKGVTYLPATSNQIADGFGKEANADGQKSYEAYILRARFPGFVREAVQMAVGMLHSQPAEINVPEAMEGIRSSKGEDLQQLLRRINEEQVTTGRLGLMADLPTKPKVGSDLPYLTTYAAERIINWDDGDSEELVPQVLNMIVLDESEQERINGFSWTLVEKYRVLVIGSEEGNETSGLYTQGVFKEGEYQESKLRAPSRLGKTLDNIPFVIINSCDLVSDTDEPPLLDLANICLNMYMGDADYRQNLFMQGQDTFVTSGANLDANESVRVGSGARLDLPLGAKAEYVGVKSTGLSEQREALDKLEGRAGTMGAQTLDSTSRERESGDSMRIRVAARTADMNQIADTGAAALQQILRVCATWMGENPDEVTVVPNKEFGEMELSGQSMVEMATARNLGFPISARSLHELAFKRGLTNRTFEEEVTAALQDKDSIFEMKETGDRNPDQPPGNGSGDK